MQVCRVAVTAASSIAKSQPKDINASAVGRSDLVVNRNARGLELAGSSPAGRSDPVHTGARRNWRDWYGTSSGSPVIARRISRNGLAAGIAVRLIPFVVLPRANYGIS